MKSAFSAGRFWPPAILALALALGVVRGEPAGSHLGLPSPASEYLVSRWTSDNGLPQNSVISMAQTADGYIWVSTFAGLARFDGLRFEVFDGDLVPALAGAYFTTLCADRLGNLWLHSEQRSLVVGRNGNFRVVGPADGLGEAQVHAIESGADGMIWVGDAAGRLLRFDGERFQTVSSAPPTPDWGPLGRLIASPDGSFWSPADGKLAHFKDGQWTIPLRGNLDCPVVPLRNGTLLTVGGSQCERVLRLEGEKTTEITRIPGGFSGYFMREDAQGNVWAGSHVGILRLDPAGRWTHLTPADGLMVDTVRSELTDREGNFWLGTDGGGLFRLKRRAIHGAGEAEGLTKRVALSLAGDGRGGMWTVTLNGGLSHFDGRRFTPVSIAVPGNPAPLAWCVHPARDGGVWIGTYGDGLLHLDADRRRVTHFTGKTHPAIGLGRIFALLEDSGGRLWFGSPADGLGCYADGVFRTWNTTNGLADQQVDALAEDRTGAIWIGGRRGLNRLKENVLTRFTTADGLAHDTIRSLYCDSEGTLWIGGRGVTRFRDGRFSPVRGSNGLPVEVIKSIQEDDLGHLWFSTPHGLLRGEKRMLDEFCDGRRSSVTFSVFDTSDGLPSNECSGYQPASWKLPDGRIHFPTLNGIAIIDPKQLPKNELPPPVVIESVMADERRLASDSGRVEIVPGVARVEVRYTALSFTAAERNRYRYRLVGLDRDWREAGTDRSAVYTRLAPANYRFEVVGSNGDGVWNGTAAGLTLTVLPAWYQMGWFRGALLLAVCGGAIAGYRVRVRALTRARELQERFSRGLIASQEAERQRIARELHDSLGQNLLVIKSRVALAQQQAAQPEKLAEQLDEAASMTMQAIREVREISQNLRPFQLDELGLTKAINAMVRKLAAASPIRFTTELAELHGALPPEFEINLYRIVQECLNNVVKHSGATQCRLAVMRDEHAVQVEITDDGRGFEFAGELSGDTGRSGFGLANIRERARTMSAQLSVDTHPNGGTRIAVTVPLRSGQRAEQSR